MINVTKTWLPDKEKYISYIDKIYESGWVTNNGPLVKELEKRLEDYLGVKNMILVANGTIALEIAYRLLKLEGEVVTTPFSFVATTSSLVSNGLQPIFADIGSRSFNIDPGKIGSVISDQTSAIVPTHVFGNACDVEAIKNIARQYNLKVIYDGAHIFGVRYQGESLLKHGDVSTLSFHATKLFHTVEGGALIVNDDSLVEEARFLINFGIDGPDSIKALGTNAKMNELEAAMGLCVLDDIDLILEKREEVHYRYQNALEGLVDFQEQNLQSSRNYSYFPIVMESEAKTLELQKALNEAKIYPRRYFYPSLDTVNYISNHQVMPVSRDIASRILCLPLYPGLELQDQERIISLIEKTLKV